MSAKLDHLSSKAFRSTLAGNVLWAGIVLVLTCALAITAMAQFAPVPRVGDLPAAGQSVPDAASQGVAGYLRAHGVGSAITAQTVPAAAAQGVAGYLTAHGAGTAGQIVPDGATQGVLDYLRAHGVHIQ